MNNIMDENMLAEIVTAIKDATKKATKELLDEMGVESVLDKMHTFPQLIRLQQDRVVSAKRALEEAKSNLELAKQVIVASVIEEKNGDGKAKFSNEKAREAEITKRMFTDPGYQGALQAFRSAEDAVNSAQFELERVYNEFSAYKAASRILAGKLNMVAGL